MKRNFWILLVSVLILGNILVWSLLSGSREKQFSVSFYNVGQGDSALIQTPDGYNILVDGGPNNKVSEYLNKDLPVNDRELDLVILTHPQSDHMYGLINVVKNFKVKKIITTSASNTTSEYKLWIDTVKNKGLNLNFAKAGNSITLTDNVTLKFNWPDTDGKQEAADLNMASVVLTVSYNDLDILMTGDADMQVQPYSDASKEIEVLKVPHHGSKTSLKQDFLEKINPKVSVISVGKSNSYGHPNPLLLEQLGKIKSKVFRTDLSGTIKIVSDGQKWYTQTEK